jgi:hypothetical protein
MKVFISWSGERSRKVAAALHGWLPDVFQDVKPWMSQSDIDAGDRWGQVLTEQLESHDFGILCLTAENLEAPWLLFEAGAIAKAVKRSRVVPYRLGVHAADVRQPLGQFQSVDANEEGTLRLLQTVNQSRKDPFTSEKVERIFRKNWSDLELMLNTIPTAPINLKTQRPQQEILEEILQLVRAHLIQPRAGYAQGDAPTLILRAEAQGSRGTTTLVDPLGPPA